MKINVSSEHIKHGKTVNALECPVALALRAAPNLALKEDTEVVVHRKEIALRSASGVTRRYTPPVEVVRFLDAFDMDYKKLKAHEPFSFDLV